MKLGYDHPLYILPFDHRHSYATEVFGFEEPMSPERIAVVAASKQVIYQAFQQALAEGVPKDRAGILVDEEFGSDILRDARRNGFITAVSTEKSGQHEFDFEWGENFAEHIEKFDPIFAKALVRYNPDDEAALNQRQAGRLQRLSDYCHQHGRLFMFELLVPAEPAQLDQVRGDTKAYDLELRPALVVRSIHELQDSGVEPDIWKLEGIDRQADCVNVVTAARRNGRSKVGCIVLGRGEDEQKVIAWLRTAAAVPGFIGFAVGRSTFLQPIVDFRAKRITRQVAASQIARRFREWIAVFEEARGRTSPN
jgi:myo-inositol catabolism protein IolC